MSCEIYGFIQYKETSGDYTLLPLFNQKHEHVCIWDGSGYVAALHNNIESTLSAREKNELESELTLDEMGVDESYYEDEDTIDWHVISLPYLYLLAYRAKDKKAKNIFKSLAQKIEAALSLADKDFLSLDDVRFVYYESY